MKIELLDPKLLNPSAYNPRKIKPQEMESLRRSIREFGLVEPLLVQVPGDRIIAGHQRRDAAIAEGLTRVPVHRLRISDARAKALNLAMNRISGEWDEEKLAALLRELQGVDWMKEFGHEIGDDPLSITGFDADEIIKLLADPEANPISPAEARKTLAERFGVPPFSVLDARQGYWQDRKRGWLALGIRGELGRGENLSGMSESTEAYRNDKREYGRTDGRTDGRIERSKASKSQSRLTAFKKVSPGGSPRPACDYSERRRGDGRGRPIDG